MTGEMRNENIESNMFISQLFPIIYGDKRTISIYLLKAKEKP